MDSVHIDLELDARGLKCPLPILRTKKALSGMQPGQVLKVVTTDPGSVKDFEAFARQTGHVLESAPDAQSAGEYVFVIRRK